MLKSAAVSLFFCLLLFFAPRAALAQTSAAASPSLRSFNEVFPGISAERKKAIFSEEGLIRVLRGGQQVELIPASGSAVDLYSELMRRQHNFRAEMLIVIPHSPERLLDKLDAYNALGNVRDLGGRLYFSHTRQAMTPLFEEATRIESDRRTAAIPDPQPAHTLPNAETIFIRLRDTNFGNTFYRGEFSTNAYGIIYRLTNFRTIRFLFFPVLREENLSAVLYMEPLQEGMLVYVIAGADVSNFVAGRIDIPSAIAKRGEVFLQWVSDGLKSIR